MIDVIIPNYNKADYLRACLESLSAQTFTDWRAIVVDGFSDDGSWAILQHYASIDKRFELHRQPRTGCLYSSWNYGMERVRAKAFCILTSDDVWPADWLQIAAQSIADNPSAVCAAARTVEVDHLGAPQGVAATTQLGDTFFRTRSSAPQYRDGRKNLIAHYFIGSIYTSIHALLMDTRVLATGVQFSEDLGSVADVEWCLQLGLLGDVIYHPAVEVGWRRYDGQASSPARHRANGNAVRLIHDRNRDSIAAADKGLGQRFLEIALRFDQRVLAYDTHRPCIANLRKAPATEIPRLVQAVARFPRETLMDVRAHLRHARFVFEAGLAAADEAAACLTPPISRLP